jgi:hypothetical protein
MQKCTSLRNLQKPWFNSKVGSHSWPQNPCYCLEVRLHLYIHPEIWFVQIRMNLRMRIYAFDLIQKGG